MSNPMSKALDLLGKKESKLHVRMHAMDDGKIHVEHSYEGGSEPKDREEYAHDQKSLHEHIDKHLFGKGEDNWADQRSDREAQPEGVTREADGAK